MMNKPKPTSPPSAKDEPNANPDAAMELLPQPERIIHSFIMHPDGSLQDVRWCGREAARRAREEVRSSMNDL